MKLCNLYIIQGLGCDNKFIVNQLANECKKTIDNMYYIIEIYCMDMFFNMTSDIIRNHNKLAVNLDKSEKYNELVMKIKKDISYGINVVAMGHSYGGFILNRLAMDLNSIAAKDKSYSKLEIYTTGSIYIAPKNKINNINLTNYMIIGDIAQRTNGWKDKEPMSAEFTKYIYNKDGDIEYKYHIADDMIWLIYYTKKKTYYTRKRNKYNILKELKLHNQYNYIYNYLLTKTNKLPKLH